MKKHSLTLVLLLFTSPIALQAQEEMGKNQLDQLVISVNRTLSSMLKSSQQVKRIDHEEIEFANARSTAELLSEFGSVAVQKSQAGGGSPQIRGFEASRVLLMIDNVRMNTLIYRAGHLQNSITINPFALDRVEILYGPSSVAYGSDALGGVVHFYTPSPQLGTHEANTMFGNAGYRFGTACNESSVHANFNIGSQKWASFTAFSFNHFGDMRSGKRRNPFMPKADSYIYRNQLVVHQDGTDQVIPNANPNHQQGSGYNQFDLLEKILYKPNARTEHGLNLQFSTTSNINRYDRLTDLSGGKPKFAEWYYGPQFRLMTAYNATLKEQLGADVNHITVAYQHTKESRHNRRFNDYKLGAREESVHLATFTYDWIKYINQHQLHAGIDGNMNFLTSTAHTTNITTQEQLPLDTRYPGGNNYMHNFDLYLQHHWQIAPNWYLNDGIRVGYSTLQAEFTDTTFYYAMGKQYQNTPTYSAAIGINYTPKGWKLALNASTGFRVPNIDDMAKVFDSSASDEMVVIPNTDIKPEKTFNIDLHATKLWGSAITWENVLYATYIVDAINLSPTTFNGQDKIYYDGALCSVYANQNHQKGYILGGSSTFKGHFTRNIYADMSINYVYGRIVNDGATLPLDHVAPLHGRIGAGYQSNNKRWKGELFALFNGKKSLKNYNLQGEDNIGYATLLGVKGEGLPAWYTLNLKGEYAITPKTKLQAGVENLLDMEYRTFASGINAAGRNIYASLQVGF